MAQILIAKHANAVDATSYAASLCSTGPALNDLTVGESLKALRGLAIVAAVIVGGGLISTPVATAGGPYIGSNTGGANARRCASTNCKALFYLNNGRPVTMICWIDAQYAVGDYGSPRWFDVQTLDSGARGFVHSSLVESQARVRVCRSNDANTA